MGNRSKYLAVAAAGTAVAALRRRSRLRHAAEGIHDTILPTHAVEDLPIFPSDRVLDLDEAHAPAHRHLESPDLDEPGPEPLRSRPWTKHAHGMTHPFSGE